MSDQPTDEPMDLQSILDATATDDPSSLLAATEGGQVSRPESSSTVLRADRWARRRGEELSENWERSSDAPYVGDDDDARRRAARELFPPTVTTDAHEALFNPSPKHAENPAEPNRAAWFDQLMSTDEYRRMHRQTALDTAMSEIGAKHVTDQWLAYAAENPEPGPDDPAPGSDGESIGKTVSRIQSTSKALRAAADAVKTAQDTAYGLGLGGGDGERVDPKALAECFQRVRNDDFLRRLMDMAGRMRTLCQTLQRTKTRHGRDDVVGVEFGGDLGRLVPSELAQLACGIDEIELLALDRVARRQAMCWEHRGLERLGKGPIVVVVDESGSMGGEPIIAAKGIALALAWLARQQKRWFGLAGFSDTGDFNIGYFAPGAADHKLLLDCLTHFYGSGTDLDEPLKQIPAYWPELRAAGMPQGKTDVIVITDDEVHVTDEIMERYKTWARAEQVQTYGIVIGQEEAGVLAELCTRHWCIPELTFDSSAVEGVLSI